MNRSRGALSQTGIDRGWPHQVALPIDRCTGKDFQAPNDLSRQLGGYSLHPEVADGDQRYLIFCFREPRDAAKFKEAFDAVPFYPEDRKGRTWVRPPGDKRRPPKARNPYDWR